MGRQLAIFLFIIVILGLWIVRTSLLSDTSTVVSSEFPLDTTVHFKRVKNLASGLSFEIPEAFNEKIDPTRQGDSLVYISKQKDAQLICFVEGNVSQKDSTKNPLSGYFEFIGSGQHLLVKNCKTTKTQVIYEKNGSNFSGSFSLIGQIGDQQFVWRTRLLDVRAGGTPKFLNMMFSYPIALNTY